MKATLRVEYADLGLSLSPSAPVPHIVFYPPLDEDAQTFANTSCRLLPLSLHTCCSLWSPRPVERIPALSKISTLGRLRGESRLTSQLVPPPHVRGAFFLFGSLITLCQLLR